MELPLLRNVYNSEFIINTFSAKSAFKKHYATF